MLFSPDWEIRKPASALWSVLDAIADRTAYLVIAPSWAVDARKAEQLAAGVRHLSQRLSRLVVCASAATAREATELQLAGLPAFHCAASALVREDFFTSRPGRQAMFDAIYDARWTAFKRHQLASRVRSLALIACRSVDPPCTLGYSLRARLALRHASWLSSPWGAKRWLSHGQVNAAYNQARVGLCLSRVEGTMFASIQYLLAGLPVVTTRSRGGRDEFFSPRYVRWVDDDAEAVADAVHELGALDLDPRAIREAALVKMGEHRARMQAWIRQVIVAEGGDLGRWGGAWPDGLPNKLREPQARAADVLAAIDRV